MRRHRGLNTLLGFQALVVVLSGLYYFGLRVEVLEAFEAYGTTIPAATKLALSPVLLPAAVGASSIVCAIVPWLRVRTSRRIAVVATGLLISATSLVLCTVFALLPAFRP